MLRPKSASNRDNIYEFSKFDAFCRYYFLLSLGLPYPSNFWPIVAFHTMYG